MAERIRHERDFELKARVRALFWAQGYSTRLDVLLAFDPELEGRRGPGGSGLTDLDVLGVRLDPGFRVHRVIADCKTSRGQVFERLFWLAGVARFVGSDTSLLVRSQPVPDHAPTLARHLDVGIVGPSDLGILMNTYLQDSATYSQPVWERFFSVELLDETLSQVSRLPLRQVEHYRKAKFWMDSPHLRLQRVLPVLQQMSREHAQGPTYQLVFADFVWLYVFALWEACEALVTTGASRLDSGLQGYLTGDAAGLLAIQRMQRVFEQLARRLQVDMPISTRPPFFEPLAEVLARLLRRPDAAARMARRAEWLLVGQIVGSLGPPPWPMTDDDIFTEKLLSDVAAFLVRTARLEPSFLAFYSSLLGFGEGQPKGVSTDADANGRIAPELPAAPPTNAPSPGQRAPTSRSSQPELVAGPDGEVIEACPGSAPSEE